MTPSAMRATRALQKENGRRLLAGEEFMTQEEIAELIDKEAGVSEMLVALNQARIWLGNHGNSDDAAEVYDFVCAAIIKAEAR